MSSTNTAHNNDDHVNLIDRSSLNEKQLDRLDSLIEKFKIKTNKSPQFVVCSTGRVNIIGDHVDYHGFPVLPMAIENAIWLACSIDKRADPGLGSLVIHNSDDEKYPTWKGEHSFKYGHMLSRAHNWHNYVLCGYHGVLADRKLAVKPEEICAHAESLSADKSLLESCDRSLAELSDFCMLIDSDLPPESGLSSSSALVCTASLATNLLLDSNQVTAINGRELAENCAKYEHLIGTQGGGMDQAVILTGQRNYAKFVEFLPKLRCENVRLPDDTVWLVSHSGVDYPKAATSGYNARVLETKIGAAIIAKKLSVADDMKLDRSIILAEIKNRYFAFFSGDISQSIRNIFGDKDEFSVAEICQLLDISRAELIERFNTNEEFLNSEMGNKLRILSRCQHVLEEAERVARFKSICDTTTDIALLGKLMTQSHYSLKDKYECSHPALDRLVGVALDAGALGARLTGAGWGGCIVTLVEASKCKTVYDRLQEVSKFTFRTEPRTGSQIISLQI